MVLMNIYGSVIEYKLEKDKEITPRQYPLEFYLKREQLLKIMKDLQKENKKNKVTQKLAATKDSGFMNALTQTLNGHYDFTMSKYLNFLKTLNDDSQTVITEADTIHFLEFLLHSLLSQLKHFSTKVSKSKKIKNYFLKIFESIVPHCTVIFENTFHVETYEIVCIPLLRFLSFPFFFPPFFASIIPLRVSPPCFPLSLSFPFKIIQILLLSSLSLPGIFLSPAPLLPLLIFLPFSFFLSLLVNDFQINHAKKRVYFFLASIALSFFLGLNSPPFPC